MKSADIHKLHEAGLISREQLDAIVAHFKLDRETNRFLIILGIIGAILVSAGVILLGSANWADIPRGVKLAGALALLIGAHGLGGWLARRGANAVLVEACHLIGAGLFLANIALVGQVYHLASRLPNAFLLWVVGISPLAFVLRSKAQFVLWLCALGVWLGLEMDEARGWLYFGGFERMCLAYVILGVWFAGFGLVLRMSRFPEFGPATEKFGLLMLHLASFPLTVGFFYGWGVVSAAAVWVLGGITMAAVLIWIWATLKAPVVDDGQWRWVWFAAQLGVIALAWAGLSVQPERTPYWSPIPLGPHWVALPALFGFCLLQAQLGVLRRNAFMVNLAMVFLGFHLLSAYFQLFGSMQTTGLMFVVTGLLLLALAVYLERKRRTLLRRMRTAV